MIKSPQWFSCSSAEQPIAASGRKSATKAMRDHYSSTIGKNDNEHTAALKKQNAILKAENKMLRDQITAFASREAQPSHTAEGSVREQQYNFFKYSTG